MTLDEMKAAIDAEFEKIRAEIKRVLGGSSYHAPVLAVVDAAHKSTWIAAFNASDGKTAPELELFAFSLVPAVAAIGVKADEPALADQKPIVDESPTK